MGLLELNFAEAFTAATARELRLAGKKFASIVDSYGENATNGGSLSRVNQFLAAQMHSAVLIAYQENVLAESVGPYRVGDPSRLSGRLLQALESPSMAVGDANGIGFIDVGLLDETARHWKRLNFGAGAAEGSLPRPRARVQFGSNQGFSLSLPDAPRPNFNVPESPAGVGFFTANGQFYPGFPGRGRKGTIVVRQRPSRGGIGARRFLDAGLVALAEGFKPAYNEFFEDASRRAASKERNAVIS